MNYLTELAEGIYQHINSEETTNADLALLNFELGKIMNDVSRKIVANHRRDTPEMNLPIIGKDE